jgi:transposase
VSATDTNTEETAQDLAPLVARLAQERDQALAECDRLRSALARLQAEMALLKRRIFVATAERVDVTQLQLEFAEKAAELDALMKKAVTAPADAGDGQELVVEPASDDKRDSAKPKATPKGRRRIADLDTLPVEVITVTDGEAPGEGWRLIGHEESWKLAWRVGGPVRVKILRPKYEMEVPTGLAAATEPMPEELIPRCMAAPSLLAHVAVDKFCDGLPLFRQSERFARIGLELDRSVMARWLEELGDALGKSVVAAMRRDAIAHSFCLATDATGIAIQPPREDENGNRGRKPCKRGHIFVVVADRDHVFFVYTAKETSAAVESIFRGFHGYIQADAKSLYDVLYRPPEARPPTGDDEEPDLGVRVEVACWSHVRRKFWEAAMAKCPVAREALFRIHRFYEYEKRWKDEPPAKRKALRQQYLKPEFESFFAWAKLEHDKIKHARGSLASAFGYALRHQAALMRPLEDGRLPLDNNRSERALRTVAVGRKNWLFAGSDAHAEAAVNIMSVIASAKLHGLDPERYLRELIRVLPHWPKDHVIELAPKYWTATRATLIAAELDAELGPLALPERPAKEEAAD